MIDDNSYSLTNHNKKTFLWTFSLIDFPFNILIYFNLNVLSAKKMRPHQKLLLNDVVKKLWSYGWEITKEISSMENTTFSVFVAILIHKSRTI